MEAKIFKIKAEGDEMYFAAATLEGAKEQFKDLIGFVPESLCHWEEVTEVPDDQEIMKP